MIRMSELPKTMLDPKKILKYGNQLLIPPVYCYGKITDKNTGAVTHNYAINIVSFKEQLLPSGFPATTVWGYEGMVRNKNGGQSYLQRSSPGATFEAVRGISIVVRWMNRLSEPNLFPVDPTLHWANPNMMPMDPPKPWPEFPPGFDKAQAPVPIVTHLHGGEVPSIYDGHPEAWQTYNNIKGETFVTNRYVYPNNQQSTTLWYHDHSLGITRLNVYAGLAGFYLLRDPKNLLDNQATTVLPCGKYEIPLVIQDKSFNSDGSLYFTNQGDNPDIHPYWNPEFFGNAILVNGKTWPNLNVERRQYRFRILNGSNARFYNLRLSNNQSFIQIGTDGGYLEKPVELTSLLIAPAERADILIDFTALEAGTSVLLLNDAPTPYPGGDLPDEDTTAQIMRFTVPRNCQNSIASLPLPNLLSTIPKLTNAQCTRALTLIEVMGENGPKEVLLNGQKWSAPITELPRVGATEIWSFINLTEDTHPMHLHLVQFQILNRQCFDVEAYKEEWIDKNGEPPLCKPTINPDITPYLKGDPIPPDPNETGWKDTVRTNAGEVTNIIVRFAPQDIGCCEVVPGTNLYPFDPTSGPGYVWHCHILDHEDNEMMRPFKILP